MPKVKFVLVSQRNRPITDKINTFILDGERAEIRNSRNLQPSSRLFTVDVAPGKYLLQLEVEGFDLLRGEIKIRADELPVRQVQLTHKCADLPEFSELSAGQQALLATFAPTTDPTQIWQSLSDNQAATFFQVTHALLNTELANNRALSSYIQTIRRIGGAQIEDDIPNGQVETATGWRLHATIRPADRAGIAAALVQEGVFEAESGTPHPTHEKFGLLKSHRQTGAMPRLQVVLSNDHVHTDLDLDVGLLHRSSPHDVFNDFTRKFPDTAGIYRF